MISAVNLIWIIPLCVTFGILIASLMCASHESSGKDE